MRTQFVKNPFAAVQLPEFRRFIAGRFLYIMGLRMMGTLIGWWMYELTGDPLALGLIGLAEVIPAVSMALYAGHVVDRTDRQRMLIRSALLYGVCAVALAALAWAHRQQLSPTEATVMGLYILIFCTGIIRAFSGPSFGAILGQLVPPELLANATTWSQGTWLSASVTGHALAGFFIAGLGIEKSLTAVAILVLAALLLFRGIQRKPPPQQTEARTWESVQEGLRYVWNTKELLSALTLDLFAVLFGGAVALVPVFAKDVLQVGPVGFGWLNAAADIGAIAIVILLTIFPLQKNQGKILLLAVAGFGACMILFALSTWYWLSFTALLLAGMLDGISIVVRGTIVQLKTPNTLRGRVMSVNSMFINSSNELGQFESGFAARLMGVVPSVVFGGCMTLAVVALTWFKAPGLRKLQY